MYSTHTHKGWCHTSYFILLWRCSHITKNIIDYITFFSSDLCCQMTSGVVYRLGSKDLFPRVHFLLWGNHGCCRPVILEHTTEWSFAHRWIDLSTGSQRHLGSATLLPRDPRHQAKHPLGHKDQKTTAHSLKKKVHMNTHTHAVIASGTALNIELL